MAAHVREVARAHAHAGPHRALLDRAAQPVAAGVVHEIAERAPVVIEVIGMPLEQPIQLERVAVAPVREQHDVLAIIGERLRLARLDDDRAVEAALLLQPEWE